MDHISQHSSALASGMAIAAVGTVAAVAIISPALLPAPDITVNEIRTDSNSAYYSVYTENFDDDMEYHFKLTDGSEYMTFPAAEGLNEQEIDNLKPQQEYTLYFIGTGEDEQGITYLKAKLYILNQQGPHFRINFEAAAGKDNLTDLKYSTELKDQYNIYAD